MKNIEAIMKELGIELTDEQRASLTKAVNENYKSITDYQKQVQKVTDITAERDQVQQQLDTANATLEGFKDVDPDKLNAQIEQYKTEAANAKKDAERQIRQRDQRDYLKEKLGANGYDVTSPRALQSLMADIMDENDGLKWKDGQFMGLDDFMKAEKEKDPTLYLTKEEKEERDKEKQAAGNAPKFTKGSENDGKDKPETKPAEVPLVW